MTTNLDFVIKGKHLARSALRGAKEDVEALDRAAGNASTSGGGLFRFQSVLATGLKAAAGAAVGAISGLAVAIGSSTSKAADLEEQMSGIAAVMGKTHDEVAPLQDLILKLGIDPKLKVSATEAADAIEMLARNGLSMSEIMEGAARNTVLLANSTGADFGTAADIATDTMSLFNIEAKDMSQAVNGITSVVNNSKFSIDDYRLALAQGGGVAATVGVSFDDFNTTIAGISPLFASGSDAGTSFKVMLQRLNPQSKEASRLMEELGIITEDGSNQFFDANGNMRSMTEISGVLNRAMGGLSDSQRNNALSTIFGTDAMRAAAGIAELGEEKFAQLKRTMGNTNAETAAATRVDNLRGSMEILSGIVETLQLRIGERFVPVIRRMIDAFSSFLDNNSEQIVNAFDSIAMSISSLIGWISNIIAPFFNSTNQLEATRGVLINLRNAFSNVVQAIIDRLPEWRSSLFSWGNAAWQWIRDTAIPMLFAQMSLWASTLYRYIADNLPAWKDKLKAWATASWQWISAPENIENAKKALKEWRDALFGWLTHNKPRESDFTDWVAGMITWIGDLTARSIDSLGDWIVSMVEWISGEGSSQLESGMDQSFNESIDKLNKALEEALINIAKSLAIAAGKIVWAIVRGIAESLIPGGKEIMDKVETFFKDLWQKIKDFFGISSPSTKAYDLAWNIWQGLIDGWNARGEEVRNHFMSVFQHIFNSIVSVLNFSTLFAHGVSLLDGLKAGIASKASELAAAVTAQMQNVSSQIKAFFGISSPSKLFMGFGEDLMTGMALGIQRGVSDVQNAMGAASLNIAGAGAGVTNSVTNTTNNAFNISIPSRSGETSRTEQQISEMTNTLLAVTG